MLAAAAGRTEDQEAVASGTAAARRSPGASRPAWRAGLTEATRAAAEVLGSPTAAARGARAGSWPAARPLRHLRDL